MDKLEKIFEECIGLNAELGYVPIKKEDVIEAMKRAYNQALEDVKEEERNNGEAIYDPKSFEEAVEPLMKWMSENQHPHTTAIVTNTRAELVEGIQCHLNNDFIVD